MIRGPSKDKVLMLCDDFLPMGVVPIHEKTINFIVPAIVIHIKYLGKE